MNTLGSLLHVSYCLTSEARGPVHCDARAIGVHKNRSIESLQYLFSPTPIFSHTADQGTKQHIFRKLKYLFNLIKSGIHQKKEFGILDNSSN